MIIRLEEAPPAEIPSLHTRPSAHYNKQKSSRLSPEQMKEGVIFQFGRIIPKEDALLAAGKSMGK
jgi:hypothetical protein